MLTNEALNVNKNRRIAVIGSGVSGAIAAWMLDNHAEVTLFEADQRFGGHTHTALVEDEWGQVKVDTGFMVFNQPNYPLLTALFEHLDIATYDTDMSFSASFDDGGFEYAGRDLNGLFGQRRNLLNARFWQVLLGILRFNRVAQRAQQEPPKDSQTLDQFLDAAGLDRTFRERYLYPMAAAIWSCPDGEIGRFPAQSFLRFFANHGLINLTDRPQWRTVDGGSSTYMNRLMADLGPRARAATPVVQVTRGQAGVTLTLDGGQRAEFDDVVMACHSDQSLRLLGDATPTERALLGAIPYQANRVLLHRDRRLMPKERRVWSSWNYLSSQAADAAQSVSVTYWMNSLQRLNTRNDYFVSLNPQRMPRDAAMVSEFEYHHPVFSLAALQAQKQLHQIQGRDGTWFAGAWTGYGFHEDGMRSGVEVARALGATVPWRDQVAASADLTPVPRLVGQAA